MLVWKCVVILSQVAPCDQAVTQGQDVVLSAKVSGQPKPMVYWWDILPESFITDNHLHRHLKLLSQPRSHTHTRPSIKHLSVNDCDSHFLLTQVEGQSHGEDGGALRRARARRRHQRNDNQLGSEVGLGAVRLQDHQRVRLQAGGVQSGGQRWRENHLICLV